MTKGLLVPAALLVAGVAGAETPEGVHYLDDDGDEWKTMYDGELFYIIDPATTVTFPEQACITTEFCGDPEEDSDVRCVRAMICGEPIR